MNYDKIIRYLKHKDGFVTGRTICRQLRLPLSTLPLLTLSPQIGSFRPAFIKSPVRWGQFASFSKRASYAFLIGHLYERDGRVYHFRYRNTRDGKFPPSRRRREIND